MAAASAYGDEYANYYHQNQHAYNAYAPNADENGKTDA